MDLQKKKSFTSEYFMKVREIDESSGYQMTTSEANNAVEILNDVRTKVKENKSIMNPMQQIRFQESSFIQQVHDFALLGLSLRDNDFYVDLRKHGYPQNGEMQQYDIGLWMQYQGEEKLLLRYCKKHGGIKTIKKDVVLKGEGVKIVNDMLTGEKKITAHNYNPFDRKMDQKNILGAYAQVYYKDGSIEAVMIGNDRIERAKKASAAGTKGPWGTDYAAMCEKTAVHVLYKNLKAYNVMNDMTAKAVEQIESHQSHEEEAIDAEDINVTVENDQTVIDQETGEVIKNDGPFENVSEDEEAPF